MEGVFTIEVSSNYVEWWRYNVAIMCERRDAESKAIDVCSTLSEIAEPMENIQESPEGVKRHRTVRLVCGKCHSIRLFINIIAHSLSIDNSVSYQDRFTAKLVIYNGINEVHREKIEVNKWGGAAYDREFFGK